jgi:multidrug resistance efflux pump
MAEFYLEYSKINHDYTLNVSIPRREELLSMSVEQSKLAFDRAKMTKSLGLSRERYELERLRETRARAVEKHAELVADRALMTLRAPEDGIAYFGRQINGRWIEVGSMESKLVPFGSVSPNSIVYTIVKDRPMYVETSVGEKDFPTVKTGQAAKVIPVSDSEVELAGSVKTINDVPGSGNKFSVRLSLKDEDEAPEWLKPGMSAKAKVTTYEAADAVVIPADLVQTHKDDAEKKYVMLEAEDEEKPVRRDLKLGKTKDKEVEVLKGLKAGDKIVKGAKDEPAKDKDDEAESE